MNIKTDRVQARIDHNLKQSVEAIFSQLGLSSREAIRLFYSQVELNGGLPFPVQLAQCRDNGCDGKKSQ